MNYQPGIRITTPEKFLFWIKRHKNYRFRSFKNKIENMYNNKIEDILNKIDRESSKFYRMAKEVATEYHKLKGFIRFKYYSRNILYTEIETEHDIIDLLLKFFIKRFPDFFICIKNRGNIYLGTSTKSINLNYKKLKSNFFILSENEFKNFIDKIIRNYEITEEKLFLNKFKEDLWDEYLNSQKISTKKFLKLG